MNTSIDLCCAVLNDRAADVDWAALSPAAWRAFAEYAAAHGVAPLICDIFSARSWPPQMPPTVQQRLLHSFYAEIAAGALLHGELQRILATLHEIGPIVLLKGAALGTTLYARPALRPMSDLDLLVQRASMPRAMAALAALGYTAIPEIAPGINQATEHHEHLQGGPQQQVGLDLHWNLISGDADWRTPPIDWFWQQTEPWLPSGADEPTHNLLQLSPTAHLLYLSAHLMLQHCGAQARLLWFHDLHVLITQHVTRIDWDELLRQAAALRWAAAVLAALETTISYFGSPVPVHILAALRAHADDRSVRFVQQKAAANQLASEWSDLMALHGAARWRLLLRVVVPSPHYLRWRYRLGLPSLWPLSYVWHWARLIVHAVLLCARLSRASGRQMLHHLRNA